MNAYIGIIIVVVLAIMTLVVPITVFLQDKLAPGKESRPPALLPARIRMITCFLGGLLAFAVALFVDLSSGFGQDFGKIFFIALGVIALACGALFFVEYRSLAEGNQSKRR